MPGPSMGALRVVLLLKESGSNRPMIGKEDGLWDQTDLALPLNSCVFWDTPVWAWATSFVK